MPRPVTMMTKNLEEVMEYVLKKNVLLLLDLDNILKEKTRNTATISITNIRNGKQTFAEKINNAFLLQIYSFATRLKA